MSSSKRVADRYIRSKIAGAQPAQDLAGVKTWVTKNRQDQVKNDTNPQESRKDYEDGKPQRDRVLPLPSGHPEGRDEQRVGPGVFNSPPDSSGQGGANRPKKDPSALNDHPGGKALHERPRSSGIPGDQYGNPYIDQSTSTGLKRRVATIWDINENDDLICKVALLSIKPPQRKQRKQKGQVKRKYLKYRRTNRVKYRRDLLKAKREYASNKGSKKTRSVLRQRRVRKNPARFKRFEGGGVTTTKQKTQRDNLTRKRKKGSYNDL